MFDLILQIITVGGVFGVAFLMFAENLFPPIPSELIMPLAGFAAAQGDLSFAGVVIAGSAGAIAGALIWYVLGLRVGEERLSRWASRHGRWITLTPRDVRRASAFFQRFGAPAMFLGRLVPIVRTWISVPAGVANMKIAPFLIWTTIGTTCFSFALAFAGYQLQGRYDQVAVWLDFFTWTVLAIGIVSYVYRVLTFKHDDGDERS